MALAVHHAQGPVSVFLRCVRNCVILGRVRADGFSEISTQEVRCDVAQLSHPRYIFFFFSLSSFLDLFPFLLNIVKPTTQVRMLADAADVAVIDVGRKETSDGGTPGMGCMKLSQTALLGSRSVCTNSEALKLPALPSPHGSPAQLRT